MAAPTLAIVTSALADSAITGALARIDTIGAYAPTSMTEADAVSVTDLGTLLTAALARCTAQEKATLGAADAALRGLHKPFQDTRNVISEAIARCRGVLGAYKLEAQRRAAAAVAEREKAAAEAAASATLAAGIPLPPVENAVEPGMLDRPAPANTFVAGVGTATTRKLQAKFEIVDKVAAFAAYPHLFVLDEAAARLELRAAQARDAYATLVGIKHSIPTTEAFGRRS